MSRSYTGILLTAVSLVLFFAALETMLALFWPQKIVVQPIYEQYHPVMGWANKPNSDGNVHYFGKTYFRRHHNQHGLRSLRDIPYEKPDGVKRVLLVGDSFFWGYGVDNEFVVSEVLQEMSGDKVEIINGAVRGYGTDQELLWLREEGLRYKPDLVILGIFAGNDFDDISRSVRYGYPKPYFTLQERRLSLHNVPVPDTRETRHKRFEEPGSVLGKVKKSLRQYTHIYPFLARRLDMLPGVRRLLLSVGLAEEYTKALPGIPDVKLAKDAIQPVFEALILDILSITKTAGSDLVLLFIPEKENTPGAPRVYDGALELSRSRNEKTSSYLSELTTKAGISYIDLLPIVQEQQGRGKVLYFPGRYDHHWTPAGHRMVAEVLAEWLKDNRISEDDRADDQNR